MSTNITRTYTGEKLATAQADLSAYLASPALIDAVNLALYLQRPLLLTGSPGIGKTRLAESVAYDFYKEDYSNYLFKWNIKSTSKVQEGIYRFDNLQRLLDVQLGKEDEVKNPENYRDFGPLGDAFRKSSLENPTILLIDEIDKASIDFPNDLLRELDDKKSFKIPETGEEITAKPLLIIITSNEEKELPPAFLRRCIYQHIQFPAEEVLKQILDTYKELDKALIEEAVRVFSTYRKKQIDNKAEGEKFVSTSELIDWLKYLSYIAQNTDRKTDILAQLKQNKIPFSQALIKNKEEI